MRPDTESLIERPEPPVPLPTPPPPLPPPRRRFSRYLAPVLVYLVLGTVAALAVAGALAAWADPRLGPSTSADAFDGEARWTASRWDRVGGVYVLSERNANW